jgi:purine-binding chemotaxis protein CheW
MDVTGANSEIRELIAFRVGRQEFSINIMSVREIRGWTSATMLPKAPRYIRGVINLRGAVLPIIDFAVRLGLPAAEPTARNVIIVVQIEQKQVGILVDAVSDILTLNSNTIQPTPDTGDSTSRAYVESLIMINERIIGIISLPSVMPQEADLPLELETA